MQRDIDMRSIIEVVLSIDLNTSKPEKIREIMGQLIKSKSILAPTAFLPNPYMEYLYRARVVNSFDEVKIPEDLSYQKAEKNTKYTRACPPGKTMFYGTTGTNLILQEDDVEMGCIVEVCDFLRQKKPTVDGIHRVVVGKWEITQELSFFTVINPYSQENKSIIHKSFAKRFEEQFDLAPPNLLNKEEVYAFQKFLFDQFNKNANSENEYWIAATIAQDLIVEFDGILWESVRCEDPTLFNVFCVAIKANSVDKKLHLATADDITISIKNGLIDFSSSDHVF